MKILKIFGIVVGIHLFALILIFANPGCSSTSRPAPEPSDTVANSQPSPTITVPSMVSTAAAAPAEMAAITPAAGGFNPDAPATYAGSSSVGVRFTPTRPNTPAASAVLSQPVENVTPATTYVVKAGDSLWTLQKKFHINLKEIAAANGLKISAPLHEGQRLVIPTKSMAIGTTPSSGKSPAASTSSALPSTPKAESAPASRPTNDEFKYTVKSGETLGTIARKFDVKTRDLAVHNNISDPRNLRAGTELSIPGWSPTGKSSKGSSASSTSKAAPTTAPAEPNAAPNLLEPSPSEPTPSSTTTVPVINIDETPVTPAPAPKS